MPGDVLIALAQFAGQTVAAAAVTDVWEEVRGRFARLLGRGDARRTEVAEGWLEQTRQQLATAAGAGLEQAREAQSQRWADRFADLLDEDPVRRLSFARWWRRSRPSCPQRQCRRLIIRWRPGGM